MLNTAQLIIIDTKDIFQKLVRLLVSSGSLCGERRTVSSVQFHANHPVGVKPLI